MLRPSRDNNHVARFDFLLLSSYLREAYARGECEDLINRVDLHVTRKQKSKGLMDAQLTSSPISPPTGTVIRTTCEYNPVQSTRRNSPDSDGSEAVIPGKYCISC